MMVFSLSFSLPHVTARQRPADGAAATVTTRLLSFTPHLHAFPTFLPHPKHHHFASSFTCSNYLLFSPYVDALLQTTTHHHNPSSIYLLWPRHAQLWPNIYFIRVFYLSHYSIPCVSLILTRWLSFPAFLYRSLRHSWHPLFLSLSSSYQPIFLFHGPLTLFPVPGLSEAGPREAPWVWTPWVWEEGRGPTLYLDPPHRHHLLWATSRQLRRTQPWVLLLMSVS